MLRVILEFISVLHFAIPPVGKKALRAVMDQRFQKLETDSEISKKIFDSKQANQLDEK